MNPALKHCAGGFEKPMKIKKNATKPPHQKFMLYNSFYLKDFWCGGETQNLIIIASEGWIVDGAKQILDR